eukprot:6385915-Pyramimonas_sp.AAC.1
MMRGNERTRWSRSTHPNNARNVARADPRNANGGSSAARNAERATRRRDVLVILLKNTTGSRQTAALPAVRGAPS